MTNMYPFPERKKNGENSAFSNVRIYDIGNVSFESSNSVRSEKNYYIKKTFFVTNNEVGFSKGQRFKRTAVRGAITSISASDYLIAVDNLVVAPSIGLPHPSLVGVGKTFKVKDETGGAASTTITVRVEGERLIDGASTSTLTTNYQAKTFYSDGSNYFTC